MKGLSVKSIKDNEVPELEGTLRKLEEDLFKSRMKKSTNQLENVMVIRRARRDIARVKTVLVARSRAAAAAGQK